MGGTAPTDGDEIVIPDGTASMQEDSLSYIEKLTVEDGWGGFFITDGLEVYNAEVYSGTFQIEGSLNFYDGKFETATDRNITFDPSFGGTIRFTPYNSLVFDGTDGGSFLYKGHIDFYCPLHRDSTGIVEVAMNTEESPLVEQPQCRWTSHPFAPTARE